MNSAPTPLGCLPRRIRQQEAPSSTTSMSNSFKAVTFPYGQREKRACQGLPGPDFVLLMRWPLFHCHWSPAGGEDGCSFDASGRVSTNAKGCSLNVSLMTGITGTTVSKLIPAKPLATNNLKIMDRISTNIHIFGHPLDFSVVCFLHNNS